MDSAPKQVDVVPIQTYMQGGWDLFKQQMGPIVCVCIGLTLIHMIIRSFIPFGFMLNFLLYGPLYCGFYYTLLQLSRTGTFDYNNLLAGFNYLVPCILIGVVTSVFTIIGFLLLIVPGFFVLAFYLFAPYLVIDKKMDFWLAMELSRKTVVPNLGGFILLVLLLALVNIAGILCFSIGLFVTIPYSMCTIVYAYTQIFDTPPQTV